MKMTSINTVSSLDIHTECKVKRHNKTSAKTKKSGANKKEFPGTVRTQTKPFKVPPIQGPMVAVSINDNPINLPVYLSSIVGWHRAKDDAKYYPKYNKLTLIVNAGYTDNAEKCIDTAEVNMDITDIVRNDIEKIMLDNISCYKYDITTIIPIGLYINDFSIWLEYKIKIHDDNTWKRITGIHRSLSNYQS